MSHIVIFWIEETEDTRSAKPAEATRNFFRPDFTIGELRSPRIIYINDFVTGK